MFRKSAAIAAFCILIILTLLLWPASRHISGTIRAAKGDGIEWYFAIDGMRLGEFEAGATYLDAIVVSFHEGFDGDPYIERNNWHLDWEGRRIKVSSTSSYDCEGTQLGT